MRQNDPGGGRAGSDNVPAMTPPPDTDRDATAGPSPALQALAAALLRVYGSDDFADLVEIDLHAAGWRLTNRTPLGEYLDYIDPPVGVNDAEPSAEMSARAGRKPDAGAGSTGEAAVSTGAHGGSVKPADLDVERLARVYREHGAPPESGDWVAHHRGRCNMVCWRAIAAAYQREGEG